MPHSNLPALAMALTLATAPISALAQTAAPGPDDMTGSWKRTCDDGPCRVFVNIQHKNELVVSWTVTKDPSTGTGTSIITVPVGVALPPGLRVYADDKTHFDAAFQVCQPDGCTAILPMDEAFMTAMADRATARVAFIRYGQSETMAYEVPVGQLREALGKI